MLQLELNETRRQFHEWGNWYLLTLRIGLDYSNKSIVGQLVDAKGMIIRGTDEYLSPENERAEEIDKLVNDLVKENEKIATVLRYHYTYEGDDEERIKHYGIPKSTYNYYLSNAIAWINRRLR